MDDHPIFRDVRAFEKKLGLPSGFYVKLLDEDDWSFVIKLNALFEGACTHALVARLSAPEIEGSISQLEFADTARGKIKLLTSLACITSEQAAVLRALAELRNSLVHNVSKITFSFDEYLKTLDTNQRKKAVSTFGYGWMDHIELEGKNIPKAKFVLENAKLCLWMASAELLACLYLEFERAELKLQKAALSEYQKIAAGLLAIPSRRGNES